MGITDGVQQNTRTKNATMAHNRADRASVCVSKMYPETVLKHKDACYLKPQ